MINSFSGYGFTCLECARVTIQRRAVRTYNLVVITHVEKHMRMIKRRAGTGTFKFVRADLYYGYAHVIVKFRCADSRHVPVCLGICAVRRISCVDGTAFGYSCYSGDSINWGGRPSP